MDERLYSLQLFWFGTEHRLDCPKQIRLYNFISKTAAVYYFSAVIIWLDLEWRRPTSLCPTEKWACWIMPAKHMGRPIYFLCRRHSWYSRQKNKQIQGPMLQEEKPIFPMWQILCSAVKFFHPQLVCWRQKCRRMVRNGGRGRGGVG